MTLIKGWKFTSPCDAGPKTSLALTGCWSSSPTDLDLWAYAHNVVWDFSRPGKPTDNAFIESFNGRFRAECLNAHWFLTLDDAQQKLEDWRRYYNEERPHGAIGKKAPITLINRGGATNPAARVEVENSS